MVQISSLEFNRLEIQKRLDSQKTKTQRNQLGQFATPSGLAVELLKYARTILPPTRKIRFFDPAFGTGSFYSALLQLFPSQNIVEAVGYEIDPHYGQESARLWRETGLHLNIGDFTKATPPELDEAKANLIICNPPYVRHQHLTENEKNTLQNLAYNIADIKFSKLASLYCYFLVITNAWMSKECLAGWLIPSGFMDVNYGVQLREYLLNRVTLLRIHQYYPNDVQFDDALVSSTVVWFKNIKPQNTSRTIDFTYGGSLTIPEISHSVPCDVVKTTRKWTHLVKYNSQINSACFGNTFFAKPENKVHTNIQSFHSLKTISDLFIIKRGLATGANKFFILNKKEIESYQIDAKFLIPILPSPRYLLMDEVQADEFGNPALDPQLFLLDCRLPEEDIRGKHPFLWNYLSMGIKMGINQRYLCKHRSFWYSQENRPSSPFLCSYMGRKNSRKGRTFRFILNHSRATASNVYLMLYPQPTLEKLLSYYSHNALSMSNGYKKVWQALSQISVDTLLDEGRVYGGGLHKLEPKELGNVPASSIINFILSDYDSV